MAGFLPNLSIQSEPPQKTPPVDDLKLANGMSALFGKFWYLFFGSLAAGIVAIIGVLRSYFGAGPVIQDLHANRANYDPSVYQRFPFIEVDRHVVYISLQPEGTVNVTGTAVTLESGAAFDPNWIGLTISIQGVPYSIAAVASTIAMTLATSAGTQVGATFQVQIFEWMYATGEMHGHLATDLPADLGAADAGFRFNDTTLDHAYFWDGTAWEFAFSDDHMAGQIAASAGGGAPLGGVWQLCDGSAVQVSQGDGTTALVTTPNLQGDTFLYGAAAETAVVAAASPKWQAGAKTDDESTHTHPIAQLNINVPGSGAVTNVDVGNPSGPGAAHHHTLSNANAVILPPSLANGGLPQNIGLVFYMRQ